MKMYHFCWHIGEEIPDPNPKQSEHINKNKLYFIVIFHEEYVQSMYSARQWFVCPNSSSKIATDGWTFDLKWPCKGPG